MRRLVIDDLRVMRFPAQYARTSAAALDALTDPDGFDEVWFDHDLGGDDTTRPVALWLEEQAFYGRPVRIGRCVVHTDNPVGRDVLRDQLTRVCDDVVVVAASDYLDRILDPPGPVGCIRRRWHIGRAATRRRFAGAPSSWGQR